MFTEIDRIAQMEFAREEGEKRGEERGREIGREEGKAEGIEATAKAMKKEGIHPETIAKCTGLSVDEIKALK